jgi:uncharacterized protein
MKPHLDLESKPIPDFCRRHQIRRLALFGSALRDDFGPESDVDLLVEFVPGTTVGYIRLAAMELELSEVLGRRVDLNTPGGLHPRFREKVLGEAEVLYAA